MVSNRDKMREYLLKIKDLAGKGKIASAFVIALGIAGYLLFGQIESEADKGLLILDKVKLGEGKLQ